MIEGPTSHRFVSQRLHLSYVAWGNTSASPLRLVHGGQDHCRSWDWAAQALHDHWHVIAVDLHGRGDSEWTSDGNYLVTDMVYDIAQMCIGLPWHP
jgi:pimeloyl-ACP methyl ester carboxylesterase